MDTNFFTDRKLKEISLYKICEDTTEITLFFEDNVNIELLLTHTEMKQIIDALNEGI